jgi:ribonuclease BN (tRNA processing enzyme)
MNVTVLGSSSSIPRPQRACSGYLVEAAGRAVIADFGTGAFANLHPYRNAEQVDAVVISHMHADHFLDVIPLRYALKYGPRTHARKVGLWLPPGGEAMLRRMVDAFAPESSGDFLSEVFDVKTYDATAPLRIGGLTLRFAATAHYIATFAMRVEAEGASVTYSADTAPDDGIAALARGTDLFLCEATLRSGEGDAVPRGHSSASEAGQMAQRAEAKRLALTHYPAEFAIDDLRAQAGQVFSGAIDVADDHDRFELGAGSPPAR